MYRAIKGTQLHPCTTEVQVHSRHIHRLQVGAQGNHRSPMPVQVLCTHPYNNQIHCITSTRLPLRTIAYLQIKTISPSPRDPILSLPTTRTTQNSFRHGTKKTKDPAFKLPGYQPRSLIRFSSETSYIHGYAESNLKFCPASMRFGLDRAQHIPYSNLSPSPL